MTMKAAGYGDSKLTSICGERMMGRTADLELIVSLQAGDVGSKNQVGLITTLVYTDEASHASFTPEPARLNFQDSHLRDLVKIIS